jgi:stage III sporulation protein AA
MEEILKVLPIEIKEKVKNKLDGLEEIRIRVNKPVILQYGQAEEILHYIVDSAMILSILQNICDNSIYAYQEQICNGYVTIKGGHRVGITGNVVIKENKVINISYINGLNFRIARQVLNCSYKAIKYIINLPENTIYNTIIVSPPGRGKTTILRDLIRNISNGIEDIGFKGVNVGLADERSEIAAMYKGIPQNDVGLRTDILDNVPKAIGMKMLIRSMNPKIIVADEIGKEEDIDAINYAVCSGVKGIFTAHGSNMEDIIKNPILNKLYNANTFELILFLDKNREIIVGCDRRNLGGKASNNA